MRHEVAGEPTLEEEQEQVLEHVVGSPQEGGITIHIDKGELEQEPSVSIHALS